MSGKPVDISGQRFGHWQILALHPQRSRYGAALWLRRCDCGTERPVLGAELRRGRTLSCGCARRERFIDLTGQRFGKWIVVSIHPKRRDSYRVLWLCRCDCGTERLVLASSLLTDHSVSCGCFRIERLKECVTTHGKSGTRIYNIHHGMMRRCYDPECISYPDYGARGIAVYKPWHTVENLHAAVGDPPDGLTLDRINNDGNYEPGNWRWATASVQRANQRPRRKKNGGSP